MCDQISYYKYGPEISYAIYKSNDGEVYSWINEMIPNYSRTYNYFDYNEYNGYMKISPPKYITLSNDDINNCTFGE